MKLRLIFLLIAAVAFTGCRIHKEKNETSSATSSSGEIKPQLIFLTFNISRDTGSTPSTVSLAKTQITEGSLKKQSLENPNKPTYINKLSGIFLDEKRDTLKVIIIDHPLFKRYEYTNADNTIGTKEVVLKESTFTFRVDYNSKMKYLYILETIGKTQEVEITKIELSF